MKKLILPIMSVCVAGFLVSANAQSSGNEPSDEGGGPPMPPPGEAPTPGTSDSGGADQSAPGQSRSSVPSGSIHFVQANGAAPGVLSQRQAQSGVQTPSAFMPPDDSGGVTNADQLRLNFDNGPLDMVLN